MAARKELSAPLVAALETWMREERAKLSRHNDVAKAMDYMLKRWDAFARFLDDGRICLSEQRRRASPARNCSWKKVVAVRGFRSRRRAGGGHVQSDRDGENE